MQAAVDYHRAGLPWPVPAPALEAVAAVRGESGPGEAWLSEALTWALTTVPDAGTSLLTRVDEDGEVGYLVNPLVVAVDEDPRAGRGRRIPDATWDKLIALADAEQATRLARRAYERLERERIAAERGVLQRACRRAAEKADADGFPDGAYLLGDVSVELLDLEQLSGEVVEGIVSLGHPLEQSLPTSIGLNGSPDGEVGWLRGLER